MGIARGLGQPDINSNPVCQSHAHPQPGFRAGNLLDCDPWRPGKRRAKGHMDAARPLPRGQPTRPYPLNDVLSARGSEPHKTLRGGVATVEPAWARLPATPPPAPQPGLADRHRHPQRQYPLGRCSPKRQAGPRNHHQGSRGQLGKPPIGTWKGDPSPAAGPTNAGC